MCVYVYVYVCMYIYIYILYTIVIDDGHIHMSLCVANVMLEWMNDPSKLALKTYIFLEMTHLIYRSKMEDLRSSRLEKTDPMKKL